MKILPAPVLADLLAGYRKEAAPSLAVPDVYNLFRKLKDNPLSADTFNFYVSVSAVFSSKIEGENVDMDSYLKHRLKQVRYQPDYTKKTDDLYAAYQLAQSHPLTEKNLLAAHKLIGRHLLPPGSRGVYRTGPMLVLTDDGRIEYVAAEPQSVKPAMKVWWREVASLLKADLTYAETFFYASLLHLVFLKIHPLADGNGRTARLVEKWFLAGKLGEKAWFLQSEKYYYQKNAAYYKNIRALGLEYDTLDYRKALPFLLMLPQALKMKV